jgi:hypothetical protein
MTASLKHLGKLGIAREPTGCNHGRIYDAGEYFEILKERMEPLR